DLGNATSGVLVTSDAADNVIAGNLISGNQDGGVEIMNNATGTQVLFNHIGTDATGTGNLGNSADGVRLVNAPVSSLIQNNTIAFNGGAGILVASGTGNQIRMNS